MMKRREVPKKVKLTPRAPLVLIWDTMRVVTVELSTSAGTKWEWRHSARAPTASRAPLALSGYLSTPSQTPEYSCPQDTPTSPPNIQVP